MYLPDALVTPSPPGALSKAEVGYTAGESAATGLSVISHDIGGHGDATGLTGSETYTVDRETHSTAKLPDDMYARWIQFGTFQPIDRLHSTHSDRLPWQYGAAARASAGKFLNLRESLVPYTYTLAHQASTTGLNSMPVFVKSGGIVPTRTGKVTNDVQNPLSSVAAAPGCRC